METDRIHVVHRSGRRICTEQEWAWAKADYLDGFGAAQIAAAYGMGLSTLRERAAKEGWRRADQIPPECSPLSDDDLDRDPDPLDDLTEEDEEVGVMADLAWSRAALALKTGDRHAARTWLLLHEKLVPIVREITANMFLDRQYEAARAAASSPVADPAAPETPSLEPAVPEPSTGSPAAPAPRLDAPDASDSLDAAFSPAPPADLHLSAARGALLAALAPRGADPP